MKGDPSAPGKGERVYYMMALRHLLPLALGLHHVRLPEADVMGADMQADDLAGLECWFVQVRRDSDPSSGVQDAVSQVAGDFMARRGVFERSASASGILPADMFCFVDHRVYEDEADELAVLGGPVNRTGFHGGRPNAQGSAEWSGSGGSWSLVDPGLDLGAAPADGAAACAAEADRVGAGNSAMVVDLPRCGPILSPCVPNLVPIPGITGSTHCAVRPLRGPRDHRVGPPTRCAAPAGQPTRTHRRRPELARGDSGRARATEPSRVAGHPRHTVALAPAPHRRTLGPTTATAGSTIDLSGASPTHTAPRSGESDLGLPPHPRRTARARPHHRSVNYLADPQEHRH